jgi:hypothetical protein
LSNPLPVSSVFRLLRLGNTHAIVDARLGDDGPAPRDVVGARYPSPRPYDVAPGVEGDNVRTSGKYASLLFADSLYAARGVRELIIVCEIEGEGGGVSICLVVSLKSGG